MIDGEGVYTCKCNFFVASDGHDACIYVTFEFYFSLRSILRTVCCFHVHCQYSSGINKFADVIFVFCAGDDDVFETGAASNCGLW